MSRRRLKMRHDVLSRCGKWKRKERNEKERRKEIELFRPKEEDSPKKIPLSLTWKKSLSFPDLTETKRVINYWRLEEKPLLPTANFLMTQSLDDFPLDILRLILDYFQPFHLLRLERISKSWRVLTQDQSFWKRSCQYCGIDTNQLIKVVHSPFWKQVYVSYSQTRQNWLNHDPRVTTSALNHFKGVTNLQVDFKNRLVLSRSQEGGLIISNIIERLTEPNFDLNKLLHIGE